MPFDAQQKSLLYHEFAKLTSAGFGIDKAAQTVLDQKPPESHRSYAKSLLEGLGSGKSIADAIAATPLNLSEIETRLVDAAEKGGKLESAFQHLSDYFGMVHRTAREARGKLIYPIVLVHLAVLLPAIPRAFADGTGVKGVLLGSLLPLACVYLIAIAVYFAWKALSGSAQKNPGIDRLLNRVPLLGKVRQSFAFARFSKVFEIFLLSGRKPADALQAASDAAVSGDLTTTGTALAKRLAEGEALGPIVVDHPAFPPAFARSLASAEEAGTLEKDLGRWASVFTADAEDALTRFGSWSTKILYGLAVLFVAWQIVATFISVYVKPLNNMLQGL